MADPTTVDGRPIEGGSAKPVAVMNPISVTLTGTIPGTVEVANDSGNPIPVSASDGALVTLGTTTDAAIVTSTAGTVIGFLRGLISLIVAKITVIIAGAGGTPVQLDDTDKLAVSLYGKGTAAGDTAVDVTPLGRVIVASSLRASGVGGDSGQMGYIAANDDIDVLLGVIPLAYNGATRDPFFNNREVTALASAARTALVNSADLVNYNGRGAIVTIDITAYTAGSLTATIKYKDTLSGKYITLLASAALAAAATTTLIVYPGVTVAANVAASAPLPRVWRVEMTVGDATSITYSVSANYIN